MVSISRSTTHSRTARRVPGGARGERGCWRLPVIAFLGSVGCAGVPAPAPATAQIEPTVLDLRAKNAGQVRRIEELENRIFILEDQLDSRKLASEQRAPATLPARALRPESVETVPAVVPAVVPARGVGDDAAGSIETTIVAEHSVDYSGEAAEAAPTSVSPRLTTTARPMLRLSKKKSDPVARSPLASQAPEPLPEFRLAMSARPGPSGLKTYRAALETLRAGDPDAARLAFRGFLDQAPQHDYADNAQYWIGECYYTEREFRSAERAFRKVVERYPRGNKVPDAMLKLGFTLQMLGDEVGGRAVLESLTRAFPKHDASRLAVARLASPPPPAVRPPGPSPAPSPVRGLDAPTLGTIVPAPLSSATADVVGP